MHIHSRAFLVAALLLCAAQALAGNVTMSVSAPKPGTTIEAGADLNVALKVAIKMGPKAIEQSFSTHTVKRKTITVLSTEGLAVVKARIAYSKHTETKKQTGAQDSTADAPIAGKTYVVEYKGGQIVVTDESGKPAPLGEAEGVRKDNRSFGRPDPFSASLPKKFTPGKAVAIEAAVAREMLGAEDSEQLEIKSATITLKKTMKVDGRRAGLFDLHLVLSGAQPPMMMTMEMRGSATIALDGGWPLEVSMTGPITLTAGQQGVDVKGDGKGTFNNTWRYR